MPCGRGWGEKRGIRDWGLGIGETRKAPGLRPGDGSCETASECHATPPSQSLLRSYPPDVRRCACSGSGADSGVEKQRRQEPFPKALAFFASIIMVLNTFLHVARSVASCFFWHRSERPGTALRTLCVVAFDFMARAGGQRLGREERRALSCLLDLGALINDHFDQHRFCKCSYRKLRRQLAANETVPMVYRAYFRELRQAERNRPRLRLPCRAGILKETAAYRETVVRISLSALAAIALGQPNGGEMDDRWNARAEEACCSQLFALVMLIQICDDLLDWRRDWRAGLPTFATAELLQCAGQAEGGDTSGGVRQRRNGGDDVSCRGFPAEMRILAVCAMRVRRLSPGRIAHSSCPARACDQKATGKAGLGVLQASP